MLRSNLQNRGLISMLNSFALGAIAPRIARVVPPTPAPNSTTVWADHVSASSTMCRSRKLELEMMDATCRGYFKNSRKKTT
jgi:hypothetical protein